MKENRFFNNTSWLFAGQILKMLLSFVVGIVTTRYLGPANYGIINYVNSYIAFFTTVVGLGFSGIMIYELVQHQEENGKILGTSILFRLIAGILSAFVLMGVLFVTDGDEKAILVVAAIEAVQLPFLCLDTLNFWYQAKLHSKVAVLVQVLAHLITSVYKIFLLVTGKSVEWFAFAITLEIVLAAGGYFFTYQRQKGPKLQFSGVTAKRLLRSCGPFIVANLMVVIYAQVDRIMIKQMLDSNEAVGLYSAASTICQLFGFLPITILDACRPVVVEAQKESEDFFNLRFRQLAAAVLWSCILFSVGITIFPRLVIFLLYGKEYLAASTCLQVVVWYTAFSYLGSAFHLWLVCKNQNKKVLLFSAVGAVFNVLANFLLIPRFGITGAAAATLVTQFLTNFLVPLALPSTRPYAMAIVDAFLFRKIQVREMLSKVTASVKKKA